MNDSSGAIMRVALLGLRKRSSRKSLVSYRKSLVWPLGRAGRLALLLGRGFCHDRQSGLAGSYVNGYLYLVTLRASNILRNISYVLD